MKQYIITMLLLIAVIISMIIITGRSNKNNRLQTDTVSVIKADTVYLRDTLKIYTPIPYLTTILSTDTLYLASGDTLYLNKEKKAYRDTICNEMDTAIVNTYISGIDASLDSMNISIQRPIIYKTTEKHIRKRFSSGIQLGVGYGMINKKPDIYIGYGMTYNLW